MENGEGSIRFGEETTTTGNHEQGASSTYQHAELSSTAYIDTETPLPVVMRYVPRLFRFDDAPLEATGLAIDMYARGAILMSSLFMGPALLTLATEAAQEQCPDKDCGDDARIYGMKSSSLLTNIAIVSGLLGAIILPLFGAIVDHTPYRRQVGIYSAASLSLIKGAEVMVSSRTWFAVALLQTISGALYYVHTTATYAYTSELTDHPKEQTRYNAYYFVVLYVSTLIFLAEVLIVAFAIHADDVGTARISQVFTFLTSSTFFAFAWRHCFRERPALSCVPHGSSLVAMGFQRLVRTFASIRREFPGLKWFMWAVISNEAATSALVTIATTYMSHFLEMDATEIGVVFLLVLIMGIPGSKLGEWLALRYNPLLSAKICVVFFILTTTGAAVVLRGPRDKHLTSIFGVFWGLGLAWLHPMDSTIFITVTPKGQETEFMALYLFCGQVLSWLPPLLFTVLNEAGFRMSVGLASLNIFFVGGLVFLCLVGDYHAALALAQSKSREAVPRDESVSENGELSLPPVS